MKQPVEKGISLCTRSVWQLQQIIASNVHCSTVRGITTSTRLHLAQCAHRSCGRERQEGKGTDPGMLGVSSWQEWLLQPPASLGQPAAPSSEPRALPVPLGRCRRCRAQLLLAGGRFSLCSEAVAQKPQHGRPWHGRPLSSGSCRGIAATPAWLERRTAQEPSGSRLPGVPAWCHQRPGTAEVRPWGAMAVPGHGGREGQFLLGVCGENLTACSSNSAAFDGLVQKIYCSRR